MSTEHLKVNLNIPSFLLESGNLEEIENYLANCLRAELIEQGVIVRQKTKGPDSSIDNTSSVNEMDFVNVEASDVLSEFSEISAASSVQNMTDASVCDDSNHGNANLEMIVDRSTKLQKRIEEFVKTQAEFFQSLREENRLISQEINEIKLLTMKALVAKNAKTVSHNETTTVHNETTTNVATDPKIENVSQIVRSETFENEMDSNTLKTASLAEIDEFIAAILEETNNAAKSNSELMLEPEHSVQNQQNEPIIENNQNQRNTEEQETIDVKEEIRNEHDLENIKMFIHKILVETVLKEPESIEKTCQSIHLMFDKCKNNELQTKLMSTALESVLTQLLNERHNCHHITYPMMKDSRIVLWARQQMLGFISIVVNLYTGDFVKFSFIKNLLNSLGLNKESIGRAQNVDCLEIIEEVLALTEQKLVNEHEAYYCDIIGLIVTLRDEVEHCQLDKQDSTVSTPVQSFLQQSSTTIQSNVSNQNETMEVQELENFDEEMEEFALRAIWGEENPESLLKYNYLTIKIKQIVYNLLVQTIETERISIHLFFQIIQKMYEDRKTSTVKSNMMSVTLYSIIKELQTERYNLNHITLTPNTNPDVARNIREQMLRFSAIVGELYNKNYLEFSIIENILNGMGINKESLGKAKDDDCFLVAQDLLNQVQEKAFEEHTEHYCSAIGILMDLKEELETYNALKSAFENIDETSNFPLQLNPEQQLAGQPRPTTPIEQNDREEEKIKKIIEELRLCEEEKNLVTSFCRNLDAKNISELENICYMKLGTSSLKLITDQIWNVVLNSRLSNKVPLAIKLIDDIRNKLATNYTKEEAFLEIIQNMAHLKFDTIYTPFIVTEWRLTTFNEHYEQYESMMSLIRFVAGLCKQEYLPVSFVKRCIEKLGITESITSDDVKHSAGVRIAINMVDLVQDQLVEQHLEYLFYIQPLLNTLEKEDSDAWDLSSMV